MKPPSDYAATTTAYYDSHAAEFCGNTFGLDMSQLYEPFLHRIPDGGRILDAGCGSGRDSLAFMQRGYNVVSIDASAAMVENIGAHLTGGLRRRVCHDLQEDRNRSRGGLLQTPYGL